MDKKQSLELSSNKNELIDTDNHYIHAATSDNTRRAYRADIEHFLASGFSLPATAEMIESYLRKSARDNNPRTLTRRMTAIRQWHKLKGEGDPTDNPLVQKTLRGIKRLHGAPKKQAQALRLEDLDKISANLSANDSLICSRNRALILVGFFGALRRSEIVSLRWEDISFERDGMVLHLAHTKTDQVGDGQTCVIPFGPGGRCPVQALIDWRAKSGLWEGHVFRGLSKTGSVYKKPISAHHLNRLIQSIIKEVGLPNPELYSAHSLRRGFATESSRLGASMPAIQKHGRWKTTKTVVEYVEAGRRFEDSAVKVLFDFV